MLERLGTVLYVDDDQDDVLLFLTAFRHAEIKTDVQTVPNGARAVDYLKGNGEYGNRLLYPLPDVIFLDWRMPVKTGPEFLEWLTASQEFRDIPVVALVGPPVPEELRSPQSGAILTMPKVVDSQKFRECLCEIWRLISNRPRLLGETHTKD